MDSRRLDGLCPGCTWRLISDCDPSESEQVASPQSLLFIPGYVVLEEIARGGMGIVYRAQQISPARVVAIKMLLPHQLGSAEMRERFRLETETIAGLEHPSILPVYEVGEQDGMPFFGMKFASGGTLVERRGEFAKEWRKIAELMVMLADAVHFAHEHGVLHRDLKPGNILFDDKGWGYVSDFGLAKLAGAESDLTRSIDFLGTPHYLAPEVAGSSAKQATTSSDIYSLGAILYELLAGRPPFQAESLAGLLRQITDSEPVAPSLVAQEKGASAKIPRDLEVVCLKSLSKEPARRYLSAREFAGDLRRCLEGRAILARPPTRLERVNAWTRRNPALAAVSATLASVLVITTVLELRSAKQMQQALTESLLAQAHMRRVDGREGQRFETLSLVSRAAEYLGAPGDARSQKLAMRLRSEIAGALALPDVRVKSRWPAPITNFENEFDFTPDLDRFVAGTADGGMALFSTTNRQELWRLPGQTNNPTVIMALSADGRWVAVSFQDGHVELHRVGARTEMGRWEDGKTHSHFAFSANGGEFAVTVDSDTGPEVEVLDLRDNGAIRKLLLSAPATAITFDSGGDKLAIATRELEIWNIAEKKRLWTLPLTHKATVVAWSGDERWLAFALERRAPYGSETLENYPVFVADLFGGQQRSLFTQAASAVQRLAFDPSSKTLAVASWDGQLVWGAVEPGGFRLKTEGMQRALRFSADGKSLAYAPTREELGILEVHPPVVFDKWGAASPPERDSFTLAVASNGRWVAGGGAERVRLWDVERQREAASLPIKAKAWYVEVLFGPGDAFLYYSAFSLGVHRVELVQQNQADGSVTVAFGRDEAISDPFYIATGFAADGKSLIVGESRQREQNDLTPPTISIWPDGERRRARKLVENFRLVGFRAVPGGEWAVSTDIITPDLWIWNFVTGERIKSLGISLPVVSELTPDGHWIITRSREEFAAWETGTWQKASHWPVRQEEESSRTLVSSPNSQMLVTKTVDDRFIVRALPDGRELIELPSPHPLQAITWAFSRDNSRIFVLLSTGEICEWHLAGVRPELRQRGLDWK